MTDGIQLGGAVGYLDGGTLENVTVKGMVKGAHRVGGVVGAMSSGTITNCTNEATVITTGCGVAEHKDRVSVGGIVGYYRNFDKNRLWKPARSPDAPTRARSTLPLPKPATERPKLSAS